MIFRFLLLSLFLFLGAKSFCAQPNVVLFLADDMGWMDSGVYGATYYETPNIDRFAKRAMRFTNAYSQPLCSPTRASLLTGQYSARHGITSATGHIVPQLAGFTVLPKTAAPTIPMLLPESKNFLEPSQVTLAETLKNAGYRTAHIGKWHLGLTQPYWPEQQGFDSAFHCHPDPGPPGEYFSPYGVSPEGKATAKNKIGTITDGPVGEYIVDRQAAEAAQFIKANKGGPFFLNLWCYGVHGPWGHKEEYTKHFAHKKDPSGRQGNPIMASMLKSVDECFGRILDELDKQGIADHTIIIFTSDNGGNVHSNISSGGKKAANENWQRWAGNQPPTQNTPLRDGKGTLYEGGTRVPMMWSWAGKIKAGSKAHAVVGPIDVYPTVIDLLGIAKPSQQHFDGVSYANVLKSEGSLERRAYFNYHPHAGANRAGGVWVREGDFKLLRWFGNPVTHELYNLQNDISEVRDLAGKMPEKVKELDRLIEGFLKDTEASFPHPNPAYQPEPKAKVADPMAGLVPKFCKASNVGTALHIEAAGRTPFLGTAQVKMSGPIILKLRARSSVGGHGKVHWRTADQSEFPENAQTTSFTLKAGADWQNIRVELPVTGSCGTVRLYLPADRAPVEIQSIDFSSPKGESKRWSFITP
jgi:arylsulfatase A-like enzyme